ncbi:hypothetical protein IMZ29_09900 [Achromobacter sp. GG226]|uniref:hypothetical protein n=1 Tax=Verticiella alkaliphila TaxID=2779529 RepID=UPI001C0BAAB9|nr:hypothetical protein [Verticiella sp. GG226]MBU4610832.1 hypothetical protein [Verticiella sp. GG226]
MGITSLRRTTVLALSVLAVSLAACQQKETPAAGPAKPPVVNMGEPFRGELTTQSPTNINDGSRYSVLTVNLKGNTTTKISLEGSLQGVLSLYKEGELLNVSNGNSSFGESSSGCCGGSSSGSQRRSTTLVHTAEADGEYQLGVSGADATRYGPFRVVTQAIEVRNSGPVKAGETLEGALSASADSANRGHNTYQLAVEEDGLYDIYLRSQNFDAFLKLSGNGVTQEDDDSGGGSDAKISAFLKAGTYELQASGLDRGDAGLYSLSVERQALPAGTELSQGGPLQPGATVTGLYSGQDLRYELRLTERQRVVIDMKSSAIDSYLTLDGPGVHATDDDSGGGSDARIERTLSPGTYTITANGYDNGSGLFTLATTLSEAPQPGGGDITVGQTVRAELTSPEGDEYRLRVTRAGRYTIEMRSETIDSYLRIVGDTVDQEDDDSGGNYDARLSLSLQPGEYRIYATSIDEDNGPYTLSVR